MRRRGGEGGLITGGLRYKNSRLRRRHKVAPRHEFMELPALGPPGRVIGPVPCLIFYAFISPGLLAQKKKYAIM